MLYLLEFDWPNSCGSFKVLSNKEFNSCASSDSSLGNHSVTIWILPYGDTIAIIGDIKFVPGVTENQTYERLLVETYPTFHFLWSQTQTVIKIDHIGWYSCTKYIGLKECWKYNRKGNWYLQIQYRKNNYERCVMRQLLPTPKTDPIYTYLTVFLGLA